MCRPLFITKWQNAGLWVGLHVKTVLKRGCWRCWREATTKATTAVHNIGLH